MGKKSKQKKEKKEESKQDKKDNRKEPKNVKPKKVDDIPEEPEEIEKVEKELDQNELNNKYCTYLEIVKKELMPQLSDSQIEKALKALVLYKNKSNSTGGINVLSGDFDDYIYINFGFTKYPMRYSLSSSQISIKNGIYNQKFSSNICLIVKNPKSDFKDLEIEFPFNLKVIDIEKLKLKYQKYEKRRELLKKYDLFLCDNRIKFVLKKLLGKCFYVSKKFPHPISMNYEDKEKIKNDIVKVVNDSTIFHMNNGPIYNIKFGRFSMTDKENIQNFKQCVEQVVPHILKYDIPLDELRNISIKGNNTIEFPIFNHIKEEDLKIFTGNI
jgi:ribosome biogenesis protein UTP30